MLAATWLSFPLAALAGAGFGAQDLRHGWFHLIWADSLSARSSGTTSFVLMDDHGAWTELELDEDVLRRAGGSRAVTRRRVAVAMRPTSTLAEPSGFSIPRRRAESITITEDGATPSTFAVSEAVPPGSKPWVTILCRFVDAPAATPRPKAHFEDLMSATYPGLGHYYREVSYGQIDLAGSLVVGWYTLPQPRSYYVYDRNGDGIEESDPEKLRDDCVGAADGDIFYPSFYGINMMFSSDLLCPNSTGTVCSFGGSTTLTKDGQTRSWAVTWNSFSYQSHGIIAHEMGHGFGLPHSSGPYGQTYDSRWDVMSSPKGPGCTPESVASTPGCLGVHTIGFHKDLLGWIPPARKLTVPPGNSGMVTLERIAQPSGDNYLMIQIPIGGSISQFYTVEARRFVGYDNRVPGEGVVMHKIDTARGDRLAQVVDPDQDGDPNDEGAIWLPGEQFVDPENGVTVTIGTANAFGFQVMVGTPRIASVSVASNGSEFGPGDRVILQLAAQNPVGDPPLDLHVGALAPDGQTLVFFSAPGTIGGVASLADVAQLRPLQSAPGGTVVSWPEFFSYTFPATGIQSGVYWIWAALVRLGALADNEINDGDVVAIDARQLVYRVPVARDDFYTTPVGTPLVVEPPGVFANDTLVAGMPAWLRFVPPFPSRGGLTNPDGKGGFTYSPSPGITGTDTFAYVIGTPGGDSNVATISVTVKP